jgi:general secretion pathway protein G
MRMMALRKVSSRGIDLPWERRRGLVRRLRLTRARPFVAILAVVGLAVLLGTRERQRTGERSTRAALLIVRRAVDAYRADHEGKCPKTLEELESSYLSELPRDAWGRPFRLVCPSRREGVAYDLSSDGPDGEPGGLDRIE